ncbi:hypothetical protein ACFFKU_10865 [Kineococcus gynurae]|uniref:Outer membrane protein n=1 Tax=Kineococcus gynurae TaxID=452979 RepID=A0ABV5LUQ7_9ACTN
MTDQPDLPVTPEVEEFDDLTDADPRRGRRQQVIAAAAALAVLGAGVVGFLWISSPPSSADDTFAVTSALRATPTPVLTTATTSPFAPSTKRLFVASGSGGGSTAGTSGSGSTGSGSTGTGSTGTPTTGSGGSSTGTTTTATTSTATPTPTTTPTPRPTPSPTPAKLAAAEACTALDATITATTSAIGAVVGGADTVVTGHGLGVQVVAARTVAERSADPTIADLATRIATAENGVRTDLLAAVDPTTVAVRNPDLQVAGTALAQRCAAAADPLA